MKIFSVLFTLVCMMVCMVSAISQSDNEQLYADDGTPYKIKSVFFGGGSYGVEEVQIQEIKDFLAEEVLANYEIHIHSHTDNIGSKRYNQYLSGMRSETVFQIVEQLVVPANQVFIKDHGLSNPEFDNQTFEGRSKNRRVDIVLWPLSI